MSVVFSGLMCHAPIVIPAVAGDRAGLCRNTTRSMRELAWRAVHSGAERLVLISPHSPRHRRAWGAWVGRIRGDLGASGHAEVSVDLPGDAQVIEALGLTAISDPPALDHGAVVPLSFLVEQGWTGPTVVIALPREGADCERLGQAIGALPGRTAVLASGDMSHRLIPEAPAGFHPQAQDFDLAFVRALIQGGSILDLPWQEDAAEDVVDSSRVARASAPWLNAQVLSYEGPWGVGYTQAIFHDPAPPLWAIARDAVAAQVRLQDYVAPPGPPSRGVFCTLKIDGELRGCIGHLSPVFEDLHRELAMVAQASASQDPRFGAVREDELFDLEIEVRLLDPPRPGRPVDPRVDGCVVTSGRRRGLLLPDIEGVDTVEQQIAICRRKARIGPDEPVELQTFGSTRVAPP